MTERTSGADGITIQLSVSDVEYKTIYELAQEQLPTEAIEWINFKASISAVLAPLTGTLLFKRDYSWCSPFLIDAATDRLSELAWESVTTKIALKSQSGNINVNIILTSK